MKKFGVVVIVLAVQFLPFALSARAQALSESLLIVRLQTSGASSGTEEFIELFNASTETIDVTGWKVEYLTAQTQAVSALAALTGQVAPGAPLLLAREGYLSDAAVHFGKGLDDAGGHVRIRDAEGEVIDLLGWDSAAGPEGTAAASLSSGRQLERKLTIDGAFIDTDNNAADFALNDLPAEPAETKVLAAPASCEDIILSEILPNPIGTDTGHEFIELHNIAAMAVSLEGCSLQVAGSTKTFVFPAGTTIEAGAYRAFYDSETSLTLPNAAGGTVVFADADSEEAVAYAANLGSDEVWVLDAGRWEPSTAPTPSQPNAVQVAGDDEEVLAAVLTPCPPGKYRNPETNRCKSLPDDEVLTPCAAGQVRNPETNRCRSAQLASSTTLTPCKEGQERSPETNRCRSATAAATTSLKPCDEGEERNPETNRCRKAATAAKATGTTDKKATGPTKTNYAVIGLVGIGALGYALYEYRQDFRQRLTSLKGRLFPVKDGDPT